MRFVSGVLVSMCLWFIMMMWLVVWVILFIRWLESSIVCFLEVVCCMNCCI